MSNICILLCVFFSVLCPSVFGDNPEVRVNEGVLRGKYGKTRGGRQYSAFMGIPYAKPPIGELRFKPPLPSGSWQGTLQASEVHEVCPQRNVYTRTEVIEGDEDCLYLNVYTPQTKTSAPLTKPLPTLVFFHGGGFLCGGGNYFWYGPDILLDREVILVVPNYRLGALGFLTTGDEVVPGNNGLKDQRMAIKWVTDNIANFGGDPEKITLFGESAGGASAHLHMLSPLSIGLFHSAISQSGNALTPWSVAPGDEGVKHGKKLAELLNCPTSSSREMVECLRKVEPYDIIAQDKKFMEWDFDPMIPFKPVIETQHEGAFLSEHPVDIIKSGRSANIPWMLGVNTEDGALRSAAIFGNPPLIEQLDKDFERNAPISLLYQKTAPDVSYVTNQIRQFYFGDSKINNSSRQDVVAMYTDAWFMESGDEAIRLHLSYSEHPIYYYLFGHRGVASFSSLFGDPEKDYGVCHADELQYLFPVGDTLFPDKPPDANDKKVAELLTTLWTNFAETGNPTPDTKAWKPVQTSDMEYYYIGGHAEVFMEKGLLLERAKFWRDLPINSRRATVKTEL